MSEVTIINKRKRDEELETYIKKNNEKTDAYLRAYKEKAENKLNTYIKKAKKENNSMNLTEILEELKNQNVYQSYNLIQNGMFEFIDFNFETIKHEDGIVKIICNTDENTNDLYFIKHGQDIKPIKIHRKESVIMKQLFAELFDYMNIIGVPIEKQLLEIRDKTRCSVCNSKLHTYMKEYRNHYEYDEYQVTECTTCKDRANGVKIY